LVLVCKNKENKENSIKGVDNLEDDTIVSFYPSVTKNKYLEWEAKNGSVLVLTSSSSSFSKAREKVYTEASDIEFNGISYRKDICKINKDT
jgi:phosphoribosylamine-glycine ligase